MVDFRYINGVCVPLNSGENSYSQSFNNSNQKRSQSSFLNPNALPEDLKYNYESLFNSFVNPNAKCPKCGVAVFYYESENGGCVYFDELGVPWTKHPCTDNPETARPNVCKSITFGWQQNKWQPFLFVEAHNADAYYTEMIGGVNGDSLFLYIRNFEIPYYFLRTFPIQIRCIDKHVYEFSTFSLHETVDNYDVIEQRYIAFDSLRIARREYSKGKRKISEEF